MSLLDNIGEQVTRQAQEVEIMRKRKEALDVAWNKFVTDSCLDLYKEKGLKNCNYLPKIGIIVPQDMDFFERLKQFCSDNEMSFLHLDCNAYDIYHKRILQYSQVKTFFKKVEPFSIILIENINKLTDQCDQTTINLLIHSWKNSIIERIGQPDIITDQHLVIFTIDEADTENIGKVWSRYDNYGWYGNIMDEK